MRTFLAVADAGSFQDASDDLSITQQAVSKRVAKLEGELGIRLFARTPRGAQLSVDGQAFLPHARELDQVADRAIASVHPGRRALRVDVLHHRIAPSVLLREYHQAHPDERLDIVTLGTANAQSAVEEIRKGTIDASFRALLGDASSLPPGIEATHVFDSRLEVLLGPRHPLADASAVTLNQLVGHRIWIPGITPGTEWADYYDALAEEFSLTIDDIGPHFGDEALLEQIADSSALATFVGDRDRYLWPAHYDLRRIPIRNPTPVYPYSFVRRRDNCHPAIPGLLRYLQANDPATEINTWTPSP